nr:DoxX family protein [Angustibacter aerolatus]
MTVVRRLARPLLAAQFVYGGVDSVRHPDKRAEQAAPVISALAPRLGLPDDPVLLTRANGATMAVAGTMLATGRLPRVAALVLAATLVPTTAAGHRFWEQDDPTAKAQHRIHFLKNAGLFGGLLLAAVDTDGRPGLSWRARRAARDAKRATKPGRPHGEARGAPHGEGRRGHAAVRRLTGSRTARPPSQAPGRRGGRVDRRRWHPTDCGA